MNIHKYIHIFARIRLASHLFTESQHPPSGLQGLVHRSVGLHVDRLQLWLTLCLRHPRNLYLEQMSPITDNPPNLTQEHAVLWLTICPSVCSVLTLSSAHLYLLSTLSLFLFTAKLSLTLRLSFSLSLSLSLSRKRKEWELNESDEWKKILIYLISNLGLGY